MAQFKIDLSKKLADAVPSTKVVPSVNTDNTYPAVVFSFRDGQRDIFYKDSYGLAEAEMSVNVYASSYSQMVGIVEQVQSDFHGFNGLVGSTHIHRMEVVNQFETFSDDGKIFRTVMQIRILM